MRRPSRACCSTKPQSVRTSQRRASDRSCRSTRPWPRDRGSAYGPHARRGALPAAAAGCFARAGFAHHRQHLAGVQIETHVAAAQRGAVLLAQTLARLGAPDNKRSASRRASGRSRAPPAPTAGAHADTSIGVPSVPVCPPSAARAVVGVGADEHAAACHRQSSRRGSCRPHRTSAQACSQRCTSNGWSSKSRLRNRRVGRNGVQRASRGRRRNSCSAGFMCSLGLSNFGIGEGDIR